LHIAHSSSTGPSRNACSSAESFGAGTASSLSKSGLFFGRRHVREDAPIEREHVVREDRFSQQRHIQRRGHDRERHRQRHVLRRYRDRAEADRPPKDR
jgi:hypothetical protein